MRYLADVNLPSPGSAPVHLRVTTQAEIRIAFREHLAIHRTMGLMADHATFAHRLVLERERARLFAMTFGAGFVHPRHREPAFGLQDVTAVRIVAVHTIHPVFQYWVMLWQLEFRVRRQMAF
jgi:hypothetical protein